MTPAATTNSATTLPIASNPRPDRHHDELRWQQRAAAALMRSCAAGPRSGHQHRCLWQFMPGRYGAPSQPAAGGRRRPAEQQAAAARAMIHNFFVVPFLFASPFFFVSMMPHFFQIPSYYYY